MRKLFLLSTIRRLIRKQCRKGCRFLVDIFNLGLKTSSIFSINFNPMMNFLQWRIIFTVFLAKVSLLSYLINSSSLNPYFFMITSLSCLLLIKIAILPSYLLFSFNTLSSNFEGDKYPSSLRIYLKGQFSVGPNVYLQIFTKKSLFSK